MKVLDRKSYYQQPYVLYLLIEQLKHRYLSVRKENPKKKGSYILSRYYQGYSIHILNESLRRNNVLNDTSAKLYFDLSTFQYDNGNTPLFNFNKKKREEDKERFNELYSKYMKSFDFAIDLDSDKDIMDAWRDAKKIKKLFDDYKLPFSIKFSGGRGFHFLIEDKFFNPKIKPQNKVILCGRMASVIAGSCGINKHNEGGTFDDSIYDDRRIFKLSYSLNYKDGKEFVCLPLSDEQFENFSLNKMELPNVMGEVKFFKRGMLTRTHNLSEKELKNNIAKFLKEMK